MASGRSRQARLLSENPVVSRSRNHWNSVSKQDSQADLLLDFTILTSVGSLETRAKDQKSAEAFAVEECEQLGVNLEGVYLA